MKIKCVRDNLSLLFLGKARAYNSTNLFHIKKISSSLADSAKNQYSKFLKQVVIKVDNKPMFEAFKKEEDLITWASASRAGVQ